MNLLRPHHDPARAVAQLSEWLASDAPAPLVIETSGSTGRPKRVLLDRAAVLASVAASAERLGASGRWLLTLPSTYVAGVQVIVRSLVAGHPPVVVADLDIAAALGSLADSGDVPLFVSLVPTQVHRLLTDPAQSAALARLHTVLVGGGGLEPDLRHRAEDSGVRIVTTYGSSETAGGCVYDRVPLAGVRLDVDADGRVRIGGPTLFRGYDGDPALTAQTLVDGWFLTSDAGRLDAEGRLEITGRIDDVAISGGVKVPLSAVAARVRAHPRIEHAEVVAVADEEWGHQVVAVVVGDAAESEVRDWVALVHPRTWAPRRVVHLASLPLLANGKIDRMAILERL